MWSAGAVKQIVQFAVARGRVEFATIDDARAVRDALHARLAAWRDTEVCGKIPERNPAYDPFD